MNFWSDDIDTGWRSELAVQAHRHLPISETFQEIDRIAGLTPSRQNLEKLTKDLILDGFPTCLIDIRTCAQRIIAGRYDSKCIPRYGGKALKDAADLAPGDIADSYTALLFLHIRRAMRS